MTKTLALAVTGLLLSNAAAQTTSRTPPTPFAPPVTVAPLPSVNTDTGSIQVGSENSSKLTSVGNRLMWMSGDQLLDLVVDESGEVRIDVASPALDPLDYRAPNEYGDERYDRQETRTAYELLDREGHVVFSRSFTPEDAAKYPTVSLLSDRLAAGRYQLAVRTEGKSKNTFGLKVQGARLSARSVNVTVLARQWVTIAHFLPSEKDASIKIYDTDGPKELELQLVSGGVATPVTSGINADLETVDITVPAARIGTFLQARIPQSAKQHSNTVGITAPEPLIVTEIPATPDVATPEVPEPEIEVVVEPEPLPEPAPVPTPPVQVVPEQPTVDVVPGVTQDLHRDSTVTIKLNTNARGMVVVSQRPVGGELVRGSVLIDGKPMTDELGIGKSGTYYFTVPATTREIVYQLRHDSALPDLNHPSLSRLYNTDLEQISGVTDAVDYRTAKPLAVLASAERPEGLIRYPGAGAVVASQDRLEIEFTGAALPSVRVNGEAVPASKLGKRVLNNDGSGGRLSYYAVAFKPGVNVIEVGSDRIEVRSPGAAKRLDISPINLSGDGKTESRLRIAVLDEYGIPVNLPNVTLSIEGAQPASPDAQGSVAGYQLALEQGVGVLRLRPQSGGVVRIEPWNLEGGARYRLDNQSRGLAVANGSVVIPLSNLSGGLSFGNIALDGRFAVEMPLGQGTLRAIGDSRGIETLAEVQNPRQLVTGDAGKVQQPLTARGPVAAEYDSAAVTARYALNAAVNPVTGTTAPGDGARADVRMGNFSVIGTFARPDLALQSRTIDSVTGLITLESEVQPGTEVVVLTGDKNGEYVERVLQRGTDYTIQYLTGTIVLSRAPQAYDAELNRPAVQVRYNAPGDVAPKQTLWSISARYADGKYQPGVQSGLGRELVAGVMNNERGVAFGVRGKYESQTVVGNALALYQNGVRVTADAKADLGRTEIGVSGRYESEGYAGPLHTGAGTQAQAQVRHEVTNTVALRGKVQYSSAAPITDTLPTPSVTVPGPSAALPGIDDRVYGEVLAEYDNKQVMVAGGVGYGSVTGVSGMVEAGLTGKFGVKLRHVQNFAGFQSVTTLTGTAPLTDRLTLKAEDRVEWGEGGGRHIGTVGLTGRFGVSQYDLTYEMPGQAGEQGRLRSGVSAEWPVNNNLTFGVRANAVLRPVLGGMVSGDLRYRDGNNLASLGVDVGYEKEWSVGLRSQATYSRGDLTLSESGRSVFAGSGNGHSYAFGVAYRAEQLAVLGTLRYQQGKLATQPGLSGQVDINYELAATELKAGAGVQTVNFRDYSWSAYAGATQWLSSTFGMGARYNLYSAGEQVAYGFGVEGTVVAFPGFSVSLGYNYAPLSGPFTPANMRSGLYLRADALLRR